MTIIPLNIRSLIKSIQKGFNGKNKLGDAGIIYLSNFSDAILAAFIIWGLGTHFTTRFGSALMGEWILISLTMKEVEKVND